jgi:hypothetical protein
VLTAARLHLCRYPSFKDDPVGKRGQAVVAVLQLGPAAKPILPDLVTLAKADQDSGVRIAALYLLMKLSPDDYAKVTGHQPTSLGAATN